MPILKIPQADLIKLMTDEGIMADVTSGGLTPVLQARDQSKAIPGGWSEIVSYYNGNQYVCIFHRLLDAQGQVTSHVHPKDAVIQGSRYRDP